VGSGVSCGPNATTQLERLTKKLAELEAKVSQQQLSRPDPPQKEAGSKKEPETSRGRGGHGRGRGGRPGLCATLVARLTTSPVIVSPAGAGNARSQAT